MLVLSQVVFVSKRRFQTKTCVYVLTAIKAVWSFSSGTSIYMTVNKQHYHFISEIHQALTLQYFMW